MSRNTIVPSGLKPVRTRTLDAPRRTAWNVSSRVSTSRTGRPVSERHERQSGSYLACCLPPNAPPGSGAKTRTLASGRPSSAGDDALEPVRVLDRAPDRDPVAVRRGHERVRLDRELGHHRERVGALDDDLRLRRRHRRRPSRSGARGGRSCPPAGRPAGATDPGRAGASGARAGAIVCDRRQLLELDPDEARRPPRRHRASRRRRRRRARRGNFVSPVGEHGPVPELRPEARHRRPAGRRRVKTSRTPGTAERRAGVDRPIRARAHVERDELHVERVVELEVGDVRLPPGDPVEPADPAGSPPMSLRRQLGVGAPTLADRRRACAVRPPPQRRPARPR